MKIYTYSEWETKILGKMIGNFIQREGIKVVALYGEMGAGKTVFTKGIASAFGIDEQDIMSSSFVIVSNYEDKGFFHVDLYRLENVEMEDMDLWEYFETGTCVVEWAERLSQLPENCLKVTIDLVDEKTRLFTMEF
ncbi:MAG: tRNA (adenosine(37)-N6)-threonylcarbamoyltransferase complex ATPase subunit type 1 TsaE [Thermodesulfovibrio sp.]|nr:tRNA (adenosine(37)-N6)-threonylcarbamoyltransferase complex ATPase subunit type 1 TsaE [Thermodesulfovibrio sp.]